MRLCTKQQIRWAMLGAFVASLPVVLEAQCTVTAQPLPVRAEGLTELVGEITVSCLPIVTAVPASGTLEVLFPGFTSITSRVSIPLTPSVPLPPQSEALLILPATPAQNAPLRRGVPVGETSIRWPGVTLSGTMRIANIRIDARRWAATAPVGSVLSATVGVFSDVPSNAAPPPVTLGSAVVAQLETGLRFSARNATGGADGVPVPLEKAVSLNLPLSDASSTFMVRFEEGFATSFKRRNIGTSAANPTAQVEQSDPLDGLNTETGYFQNVLGTNVGLATNGTRLSVNFTDIPAGARLFVTTTQISGVSSPRIAARLVASSLGPFRAAPATTTSAEGIAIAAMPALGTTATAVWEILESAADETEFAGFGVIVSYEAGAPAIGTASVTGSLVPVAPFSPNAAFDPPIPNFAGSIGPLPAFAIGATTPAITGIDRAQTTAGAGGFPLVISGTGLFRPNPSGGNPGSTVYWNGVLLVPQFLSDTEIAVAVPPNLIDQAGTALIEIVNPGLLRSLPVELVVNPPPRIITSVLTGITQSVTVDLALDATGGTPPYTWSGLPNAPPPTGLTITPDGRVAGSAETNGPQQFAVRVTDREGVSDTRIIEADVEAENRLLMDIPPTVAAGQSQTVYLKLSRAANGTAIGRLSGEFRPNAMVKMPNRGTLPAPSLCNTQDTPMNCLAGEVDFSLPAGNTEGISNVFFRTGTVAGEMDFHALIDTPAGIRPPSMTTALIPATAPLIDSVRVAIQGDKLLVIRVGAQTTTREASRAVFQFAFERFPGFSVDVDVTGAFERWFREDMQSVNRGGEVCYLQTFKIEGDRNQIAAITVSLANQLGQSQPHLFRVPLGGLTADRLACP